MKYRLIQSTRYVNYFIYKKCADIHERFICSLDHFYDEALCKCTLQNCQLYLYEPSVFQESSSIKDFTVPLTGVLTIFSQLILSIRASLVAQMIKNLFAMQETQV